MLQCQKIFGVRGGDVRASVRSGGDDVRNVRVRGDDDGVRASVRKSHRGVFQKCHSLNLLKFSATSRRDLIYATGLQVRLGQAQRRLVPKGSYRH